MYSKMIPALLITMHSTYSTQCTVRLLYLIPLSVFEGSRIPSKFKEEFNSRLPNPHVISFNIRSLFKAGHFFLLGTLEIDSVCHYSA
jgi:hypothetical protein